MDSPRTRSDDRARPGYGFQKDSQKTPNGFQGNRNPGRDGQGRDTAVKRSAERFAEAHAWAIEHLPEESPNFAGGAFLHMRWVLKRDPSVDEVRGRLQHEGHDAASLDAAGVAA
jgi:hypothetical protein